MRLDIDRAVRTVSRDRVELRQVGWIFRAPMVFEKGGADDQHALGMTESLRHQSGNVFNSWQSPESKFKSFLNHIDGPVRRFDAFSSRASPLGIEAVLR
jgi:hypothetical protein